ncbi:MAG TPA: hypothetical protein VF453_12510, partial [Burkholderiaceae bacterium]
MATIIRVDRAAGRAEHGRSSGANRMSADEVAIRIQGRCMTAKIGISRRRPSRTPYTPARRIDTPVAAAAAARERRAAQQRARKASARFSSSAAAAGSW